MDDSYSFGAWVRRRRKARDLTQAELARQIGVAAITIQKIEADERRPSRQVAELLADQLHVPTSERESFLAVARGEQAVDRLTHPRQDMADTQERRVHLPHQLSSFIGRQRELAELPLLLQRADVRLMTLTGPGGSGKTRLALRVAEALVTNYPDAVWFVDLSAVSDPDQVAATVAQVLGIPQVPDVSPQEQVITRLREHHALLLIDNCEQVLEATADLVAELLKRTSSVTVLATSRMPLRITAEHEYAVAPLALPISGTLPPLDQLSQYDALALFIARARAVRADFAITTTNASAIIEICARLDGLPLAIELAAARVKLFRPEQLLERVQRAALPTLTGGARDLPARQQTIRATIDWSYQLLGPTEQALLARLGVFVGGWTLDAAEAVCGGDTIDVTIGMSALVEHSLVRPVETDAAIRFTMLETIREFALERLLERGEEMVLRDRHTMFFIQLAETAEPKLRSAEQVVWLARLDADYENLYAVLAWCLPSSDIDGARQVRGLRLVVLLCYFWLLTNRGAIALAWLNAPWVNDLALTLALRARMLVISELIHGWIDSLRFYLRYLAPEGLALVRSSGDRATIALALAELALTKTDFVHDQAISYATEARALAIELGDPWLLAYAQLGLGAALNYAEQKRHAGLAQLHIGLELVQQTGDRWLEAYAHWTIGLVLLALTDYAEARAAFERQVACYNELGDSAIGKELAVWGLGAAAEGAGLIDLARNYQIERARYALLATSHPGVIATHVTSAGLAIEQGEYTSATDDLRQSRAILLHFEPTHRQYFSIVLNLAFGCWEHVWFACAQGDLIRAQQEVAQFDHYMELAQAAPYQKDDMQRLQYLDGARAVLHGLTALFVGNLASAQQYIDVALTAAPDDMRTLILAGRIAFHQGDYTSANKLFAQALSTNDARTWPFMMALTLIAIDQGRVFTATGDLRAAREQYHNCLPFLQRGRLRPWIAKVLEGCAVLATLQHDPLHASRFWGANEALREQLGAPMWPVDRPEYERCVAEAKAQSNPEEWDAAWAIGRALTWEQAADQALAWLAEVRAV